MYIHVFRNVQSPKISIPIHGRSLEVLRGWGSQKRKILKQSNNEAKMEFQEGWGIETMKHMEGLDKFWNNTIIKGNDMYSKIHVQYGVRWIRTMLTCTHRFLHIKIILKNNKSTIK